MADGLATNRMRKHWRNGPFEPTGSSCTTGKPVASIDTCKTKKDQCD